jgi:hypothetical protein
LEGTQEQQQQQQEEEEEEEHSEGSVIRSLLSHLRGRPVAE